MTDVSQTDANEAESPNMKHLREKAERSDAQAEEIRMLKTDRAFTQAGINIADGTPGALLYSTFQPAEDGEITAAAVLEYAQRFGVTPILASEAPATGEPEVEQSPQAQAEQGFFNNTSKLGSGSDMTVSDPDPNLQGFQEYTNIMKAGGTQETAVQAGLGAMLRGAAAGDKRMVYDQEEFRRRNA